MTLRTLRRRGTLTVTLLVLGTASLFAASACSDASTDTVDADDAGTGGDSAGATDAALEDGSTRGDDGGGDADAGDGASSADAGDGSAAVDAGAPVIITFAAKVGDAAFRCGDTYPSVGTPPREMTPVDFRFYVHDVRVVDDAGQETPLALTTGPWQVKDIALLDFENATGACADGDTVTNAIVTGHLPSPRPVKGLKFRLGVPQSQNHGDLSSEPPPLDRSSLFWAWRSGHIFFAAVGRTRVPVGTGPDTTPYNHYTHLGSVGCMGDPAGGVPISSCAKPNRPEVVLADFDPTTKKVVVDFAAVKEGTDLTSKGCHADGDHCAAAYGHLGIDWSTGGYTDLQSVFGVE